MKEIASVWETDLGNRWEALDAWKKVAQEAPEDADAKDAMARLDQGRRGREDAPVISAPAAEMPSDEFADLTDPSEEQDLAAESGETTFDPGLYRELLAAQAELQKAARQTAKLDGPPPAREEETRNLHAPAKDAPKPAPADPPTRELNPPALAKPARSEPAASTKPAPSAASFPGIAADDFDDDYTAVADDVFDQIRDLVAHQRGSDRAPDRDTFDGVDEIHTGEIQLLDEEVGDSDVEEIDDAIEDIGDDVEELDDAIEELDDIDELEAAPPLRSVPPPPPGSSPPPRRN